MSFVVEQFEGRDLVREQVVVEVRYRAGYTYLDRCGELINRLLENNEDWMPDPKQPNPQGAKLISCKNSAQLSVGTQSVWLQLHIPKEGKTIGHDEFGFFVAQLENSFELVFDILGINDFSRLGFRQWFCIRFESSKNSQTWMESLGWHSLSQGFNKFGECKAKGFSAIFEGGGCDYRVSFNGVERPATVDLGTELISINTRQLDKDQGKAFLSKARQDARLQRSESFACMIDVDAFQKDPELPPSYIGEFLKNQYKEVVEKLRKAKQ